MCGLAGFLDLVSFVPPVERSNILVNMAESISHRGPDDSRVWFDIDSGIGLSHTRLSILDLSPTGRQPMRSNSGRYVIVFNGEIYNHLSLRKELLSASWKGHSDTETLIEAIESWGLEETLKRSVGMFALAIWDKQERVLQIARDRIGEKPLYYGWQNGVFLFGSELKALRRHPAFEAKISDEAVGEYFNYSYIPSEFSIYSNIFKLSAGSILKISINNNCTQKLIKYWDLDQVIERGLVIPFRGNDEDAIKQTETILRESVMSQLLSDVPLGAFLSGGVDSSLIVAIMQQESATPVKTFTIGFENSNVNEARYAKAVAKYLGTQHTEEYISSKDILDFIPRLSHIYDEPFADTSQLPTCILSQITKKNVTVSLSGDGGDELFGGYNRHYYLPIFNNLPYSVRKLMSLNIQFFYQIISKYNNLNISKFLLGNYPTDGLSHKLQKLNQILNAKDIDEMYLQLQGEKTKENLLLKNTLKTKNILKTKLKFDHYTNQIMYRDTIGYLTDDILVKVDRASMASSLESRSPYLDHRLVEFAWTLPISMKIRKGKGKWVLRKILSKYVPDNLINRPKMGFSVPIAEWLRGPLKDWAADLLDPIKIKEDGFINHEIVNKIWKQHQNEEYNWKSQLWTILMFQEWMNSTKNNR